VVCNTKMVAGEVFFFGGGEGYVFKASFLLIFLVVIVVAGADTCFFFVMDMFYGKFFSEFFNVIVFSYNF